MITAAHVIGRGARAAVCALCLALPALAGAQERLLTARRASITPTFQSTSLADPLPQPVVGGTSPLVESAWQWSMPISVVAPIGQTWTVDVSGGWASGEVQLAEPDDAGKSAYALDGFTDFKVRLTGRLRGDNLLFTVGVNVPTGRTSLNDEELGALNVLSSPALAFDTPALGTGLGGTVGMVYARRIGQWAYAAGAAYERRATYNPWAAAGVNFGEPEFAPGDAIRLSLGADGLVGNHGMTLSLSVDAYTEGELTRPEFGGSVVPSQLGPIVTGEWQLRVATTQLRELSFRAIDRYRSSYSTNGKTVSGSEGNYLDVSGQAVWPTWRRAGLLTGVHLRHQTGMDVDDTFATAGAIAGGATLGVVMTRGMFDILPFARATFGTLDTGPQSSSMTQLSIGIGIGARR